MRRTVRLLLGSIVVVGILIVFVLPGRSLFQEEHDITSTQKQIQVLSNENATLKKRAKQLQNPTQIEQIARQEYGLILPGEKAYAVIPPTVKKTAAPPPAKTKHHSFWHRLEFWN